MKTRSSDRPTFLESFGFVLAFNYLVIVVAVQLFVVDLRAIGITKTLVSIAVLSSICMILIPVRVMRRLGISYLRAFGRLVLDGLASLSDW